MAHPCCCCLGCTRGPVWASGLALEDINLDGHVDLVVGAPAASPEISGAASISLYLGPLAEREDGAAPDFSTPSCSRIRGPGAVLADIGPLVDDRQFFAVQATTKVGGTLGVKLYRVTERAGLDDSVEVWARGLGIALEKPSPRGSMRTGTGSRTSPSVPGAGADDLIAGAVYVFLSPVDPVMTTEDADLDGAGRRRLGRVRRRCRDIGRHGR